MEGFDVRMAGRALWVGVIGLALLAFGSSLGAAIARAQAAPTLKVDPSSGVVGTTVLASPAAGGGGSSTGLTWAMVLAAGVFLAALLGMAYVLWRSRRVPALPPPPVGPIAPYEEVVAALTPHGRPEGEHPVTSP